MNEEYEIKVVSQKSFLSVHRVAIYALTFLPKAPPGVLSSRGGPGASGDRSSNSSNCSNHGALDAIDCIYIKT